MCAFCSNFFFKFVDSSYYVDDIFRVNFLIEEKKNKYVSSINGGGAPTNQQTIIKFKKKWIFMKHLALKTLLPKQNRQIGDFFCRKKK